MVQTEKNILKSVNVILQAVEIKIKYIQCMFLKRRCWNLYLIFLKYLLVMVKPIVTISIYCDILFLLRTNVYKKFVDPSRH